MESPPTSDIGGEPFDSSKPFDGLVLCCTSIEADQRTEIAQRTADMGGIHKYDLTPDVTHLIVGDYDTAKYRHVARERPDIKPMAAGWVDAVRCLWLEDREIDFAALENEWRLKTFESSGGIPKSPAPEARLRTRLVCCLTGFEDGDVRAMIEDKVRANGGEYIGDLSRRVTHLIVCKPEGKKYVAAKRWGIRTVSIEWLHNSVERGMILNEECYDPTLPPEERGKGAWVRRELKRVSLGKRTRDGTAAPSEDGRRKLRKTASMKLNSQRDNLWGDILVKQSSTDLSKATTVERPVSIPSVPVSDVAPPPTETPQHARQPSNEPQKVDSGVFDSCRFFVYGFSHDRKAVVYQHISSHHGQISESLQDAASRNHPERSDRRYLLVPQLSQPDSHPQLPEGMHIVTEFYIERCVHNKMLFKPNEHVLGQPFPQFPIEGFSQLTICTAGFRNEQLNQVEKTVSQLGARYSERLNSQSSVLICPSLDSVRKQKLEFAVLSKVPVVRADWLWQCITTGCFVPWDNFLFKELGQESAKKQDTSEPRDKEKLTRSKSEPVSKKPTKPSRRAPRKAGFDLTAFEDDETITQVPDVQGPETEASNYETAPTHQEERTEAGLAAATAPLSEVPLNALNQSPSSQKTGQPPRKLKRFPTEGTVGDSEGGEDSDTPASHSDAEATARNKEEERRRQAERVKAAEREELSKRLNSLMTHGDAEHESDGGLKPQPAPRPPRRKREIMGRAASNVSATSSTSAESLAYTAHPKPGARRADSLSSHLESAQSAPSALSGLLDKMMEAGGGANMADGGESPPRATQVEYDNPDARAHRAAVMDRMMGNGNKEKSPSGDGSQERVTLANLKGAEESGSGTKRTMRRRL
ncbi:hypothetical protein F5B20DRAFT_567094 [Whalleya microplaca]|nr:hypothetical protein F5B20DRAFT_567094 [Whalleya microplaca]